MTAPLDEAVGRPRRARPALFGARHAAAVGGMIHAQQVQQAVQHEDLDLLPGVVAEGAGLGAGAGEGDGDVAEMGARGRGAGAGKDSTSVG